MALPAGDPYWYYKVLGLHCDGTNGSTTFTDVKGKTVTVVGNTQISTAQYPSLTGKSSSAILDGSGDALTLANSTDFTFSGDFAIRCRVRFSGGLGSNITLYNDEAAAGYGCLFQKNSSDKITFTYMPDNAASKTNGGNLVSIAGATSVTTGVWYTFEVSRSGTSCKVFLDGAEDGSGTISSGVGIFNPGGYKAIGGRHYNVSQYFNGYLSEIEVYKGIPLNTATYTPSSDPFPDTYVRISGTTEDAVGDPAQRLVRVYRRDTGALVEQVVSNATTGEYVVTAANSGTTTPLKHVAYMHTAENGAHVPWRVLGLHCDGANNSTTFTDVKGKTVTAAGNAKISTAQYPALTGKSSSAVFDGTGDYLSSAASSDFNFGTGDFTIRCMFYLAADSSVDGGGSRNARLFCLSNATTTFDIDVEIQGDASTTGIGIAFYSSANGLFSRTVTITKDVWHDVEVSRSGTSLRIFFDGTQLGATFTNSASWGSGTYGAYVGGAPFGSNYYFYFNGYISEVEVYKGVALHTEDFTPLTVPFYDAIGTATDNAVIFDDITPY